MWLNCILLEVLKKTKVNELMESFIEQLFSPLYFDVFMAEITRTVPLWECHYESIERNKNEMQ